MSWTPERVEQLIKLRDEGNPLSRIASIMGVSRETICSKVHRLDLPPPRLVPRSGRSARASVAGSPHDAVHPPSLGLSIFNLTNKTCKWPHGDGPYTFCGQPTDSPPYCTFHAALANGRGTPSERQAHKEPRP